MPVSVAGVTSVITRNKQAKLFAIMKACEHRRACAGVFFVGEWLSLVEHLVRDQGVGGSNPLSPTIQNPAKIEDF
jgi:hypothetical protein